MHVSTLLFACWEKVQALVASKADPLSIYCKDPGKLHQDKSTAGSDCPATLSRHHHETKDYIMVFLKTLYVSPVLKKKKSY